MSYQPQVGDRVTDANHEDEGTVLFVHGEQAVVQWDDDDTLVAYRVEHGEIEPRPKVREQSCAVGMDGYLQMGGPSNARIVAKTYRHPLPGAITVAVVCDLDGNPLEVQT